ncbi:MAG: DUF3871 family protein [Ferruginibacter sp.]|nr:DUF3871 family protein [Ferruginibacter sp.]
MEHIEIITPEIIHPVVAYQDEKETKANKRSSFIEANTIACSLEEMKSKHIIPVFVKDNETLISHDEFIDAASTITADIFHGEHILKPNIRVSHPIKGRIPEAKDKPANQLYEWEKTLYYERMMFVIEVPSLQAEIGGNTLSLTVGGVKAYNHDNLYSRNQSEQHFKIFIGFQNKVCTNLCVWTDGLMSDVKVNSLAQLKVAIRTLVENYNHGFHLQRLEDFTNHALTENQFAHLIGRCRMYTHLPGDVKKDIPPILFGDTQMSAVVKDYYRDESFCRDNNGNINLWKLYNLFTGANKSTYIDSFLERSVNAFNLVEQVRDGLDRDNKCWYLS